MNWVLLALACPMIGLQQGGHIEIFNVNEIRRFDLAADQLPPFSVYIKDKDHSEGQWFTQDGSDKRWENEKSAKQLYAKVVARWKACLKEPLCQD